MRKRHQLRTNPPLRSHHHRRLVMKKLQRKIQLRRQQYQATDLQVTEISQAS